jgi:beta-N-acetylhexosaminidase
MRAAPSVILSFLALVLSTLSVSCAMRTVRVIPQRDYLAHEAAIIEKSLTTAEKSSLVLMTGIDGKASFSPALRSHYRDTVPGAILLFRHNIADSAQSVRFFLSDCDFAFFELGSPFPALYAIDNEGGDVFRTAGITSRLPSASKVAKCLSPDRAQDLYRASGAQLVNLGIGLNLAPVTETLTKDNEAFLGTRTYGDSPETVAQYASAAVSGFQSAGVSCAIKHFPGNGIGDPHRGLPCLDVSLKILKERYVEPFKKTLASKPAAVLVSHVIVSAVDPERPFCLSEKGVTGILRKSLRFDELVITDDVAMSALSKNGYTAEKAAVLALKAGCDMIMTSAPDIRKISSAIAREAERDPAFSKRLDEAAHRVVEMKVKSGTVWTAHERLALSMMGDVRGAQSGVQSVLDERLLAERREAEKILGEMNGK